MLLKTLKEHLNLMLFKNLNSKYHTGAISKSSKLCSHFISTGYQRNIQSLQIMWKCGQKSQDVLFCMLHTLKKMITEIGF